MLKGGNWLQLFQAEDFLRSIDRDASAIAIYALKGNEQYVEP